MAIPSSIDEMGNKQVDRRKGRFLPESGNYLTMTFSELAGRGQRSCGRFFPGSTAEGIKYGDGPTTL